MKERKTLIAATPQPDFQFDWQQVAAGLFATNGIKSGWWRLGVQLRFAALTGRLAEPGTTHGPIPVGMLGVDKVVLFAATQGGDLVFDASRNAALVPADANPPPSASATSKPVARKAVARKSAARKRLA